MEQGEQKGWESGEGKASAGESVPPVEEYSFARLLERFYLKDNLPMIDVDAALQTKSSTAGG